MKKFNKLLIIILTILIIPFNVIAYSNYVIAGGDNIGIEIKHKYVTVVGFYKVNNKYIGKDSGFLLGDEIVSIEDNNVYNVDDIINILNKYTYLDNLNVKVLRNNKSININLPLIKDNDGGYKTGLYVKDKILGIGTLTYIDPESNIFGALGHEIIDKNTNNIVKIDSGDIYSSTVTNIRSSKDGDPGEKKANIEKDNDLGDVKINSNKGLYGLYSEVINSSNLIEVGSTDNIHKGKALIRTVIDGKNINDYEINIIDIDYDNETKNILFEVTDTSLLENTGGVVAGMSGSPIIQDNKIIGAVTHVIINDSKKGYGIFITTMLENGDKLKN